MREKMLGGCKREKGGDGMGRKDWVKMSGDGETNCQLKRTINWLSDWYACWVSLTTRLNNSQNPVSKLSDTDSTTDVYENH